MSQAADFIDLHSDYMSLIFDCRRGTPCILYFGKRLNQQSNHRMLEVLSTRQEPKCALAEEVPISLSPCLGNGFTGSPGITLNNTANAWSVGASLVDIKQTAPNEVCFISEDRVRGIEVNHQITLDLSSHVVIANTLVRNLSQQPLTVTDCAAPTFAIPDHVTKVLSFEGRWALEFQQSTIDLFLGAYVRENRKGKTSHDNFPGVLVHDEFANESQGECYGFHLGWSGNHRTRVELLPEQRTYVQMGELLGGEEIQLKQGESYQSPNLYVSYSANGFGELSHHFHTYVRQNLRRSEYTTNSRPVFYNTWEGIYFDHNLETMKQLADITASVGAQRFVLDDGWFKGRNSDTTSLGDWTVDEKVYPQGLSPIIDYVKLQGMEFGIWFEPEMVNPDSDLYRAHPEWVLSSEGNPQIMFRNQLVLDLTRQEVSDYLFSKISAVLSAYPDIVFIKWDMNRDINHTGNANGKSAIHLQTKAVYALIARVKSAHPHVEIESCSSGGGRIDYGILAHTDRVWTSDSNDALDRLSIQRGASFFFPLELLGSHVGPRDCHITGRRISMDTRIAVALFASMGMEMDPRELTSEDKDKLKAGVELYKAHRGLIHSGRHHRLDSNENSIDYGVVSHCKTQALFAYNHVLESRRTQPKRYRFVGLDKNYEYRFNLVWPTSLKEYSPSILSKIENQTFSGEVLMQYGMQLPITFVQTSLIFKLHKV